MIAAFSLAEPYATLTRRHNERRQLRNVLENEMKQLARTQSYQAHESAMSDITTLLLRSTEEEKARLDTTVEELLRVAEIIPLTSEVLASALGYQTQHDLSPPDAIVYAAVRSDLGDGWRDESCFLNRNVKDFDDPDIHAALAARRCRLLLTFQSGLAYLKSWLDKR